MQLQDVQKLAQLARIAVPDDELEAVAKDMDSILAYIQLINQVSVDVPKNKSGFVNQAREDVVTNETGMYTDAIISQAPARDGNYVKVKKIL